MTKLDETTPDTLSSGDLEGLSLSGYLEKIEASTNQMGSNGKTIGQYIRMTNAPDEIDSLSLGESLSRLFEGAVTFYHNHPDVIHGEVIQGVGHVLSGETTTPLDSIGPNDFRSIVDTTTKGKEAEKAILTISNCGDLMLRENLVETLLRSAKNQAYERRKRGKDSFNHVSFKGNPHIDTILHELDADAGRLFFSEREGKLVRFGTVLETIGKDNCEVIESLKRGALDYLSQLSGGYTREQYIKSLVKQSVNDGTQLYTSLLDIPTSIDGEHRFHKVLITGIYMSLIEDDKFDEKNGVTNGDVTMKLQ